MKYRVLVVEDHEWWRRYLSSALESATQWEIVGAVSDGIEAVQKARDLKPDVILLDIGLPGLNGIHAARQILADDPSSRILFVTEQQSLDIVEVALGTGARGYIVKSTVGRELLPAMNTVVEGGRFVSAKFAGRGFEITNDGRVAWEVRCHEAGFYADESSLLKDYVRFAEGALDTGNGLVMVVTSSRRDRIYQQLQARGIDIDRAIRERRCLWRDVPAALASFIVDGQVDEARFWNAASALIMEAARGSRRDPPRVSALRGRRRHLTARRPGGCGHSLRAVVERCGQNIQRRYFLPVFEPRRSLRR